MAMYNNVQYIDPNKIFTNNGANLMPPLEDLNAMAELIVTVLPRTVGIAKSEGVTIQLVYSTDFNGKNKTIGILHGKDKVYVNNGESSFMTTEPNTFSLQDSLETNGVCNEMFGISNIDVSYNSFMVPQVDIKFVDIRGLSVFSPEELARMKGNSAEITRTFFGAFFSFPYPKFNLILKGYYGKPVSYELNLQDFKARFNHEDGSMCIDAKFIGYEESFLNDISMNMLFAAPFTENGEKYWDAKYGSTYTKLYDIYDAIRDAIESGINPEDLGYSSLDGVRSEQDQAYADADVKYNDLKDRYIRSNESVVSSVADKNGCKGPEAKFVFCKLKEDTTSTQVTNEGFTSVMKVDTDNPSFSQEYLLPDGILYKDSNTIVCLTTLIMTPGQQVNGESGVIELMKNSAGSFLDSGKKSIVEDLATNGFMGTYDPKKEFGGFADEARTWINSSFTKKVLEEVKGKSETSDTAKEVITHILDSSFYSNEGIVSVSNQNRLLNLIVFSGDSSVVEELDKKIATNSEQRDASNLEAINRLNERFAAAGNPNVFTIEGVIKSAFAHLDTAMYLIENYVDTIQTECTNGDISRKAETYGDAKMFSDVPKSMAIIPPFPEVTKPASGMNMGTWPGDEIITSRGGEGLKEVALIHEIMDGVKKMSEYGYDTDNRSLLFDSLNVFTNQYVNTQTLTNFVVQEPISVSDVIMNDQFKGTYNPLGEGIENATFGNLDNPSDLLYRLYLRYLLLVDTKLNSDLPVKANFKEMGKMDGSNFYDILIQNENCQRFSYENLASLSNNLYNCEFFEKDKFLNKMSPSEGVCYMTCGNYDEDLLDYFFGDGTKYDANKLQQCSESQNNGIIKFDTSERGLTDVNYVYDFNNDFLRWCESNPDLYNLKRQPIPPEERVYMYMADDSYVESTYSMVVEKFKKEVKEKGWEEGVKVLDKYTLSYKMSVLVDDPYFCRYTFDEDYVKTYSGAIEEYCKEGGSDAGIDSIIKGLFEEHLYIGSYKPINPARFANSTMRGTSKGFDDYLRGFLSQFQETFSERGFAQETTENMLEFATNMASVEEYETAICVSFYNYLKVIYDRWLSGGFDMSKALRYDSIVGDDYNIGHLFFIDSYYNKTGYEFVDINKLFIVVRNCLENVEMTLLQFITQVLQDNNYQFFCLQNFMDLSEKTSFETAFKPIPFNECDFTDFSQDFVCVLCNDYADKLNSNEGFKSDSFVLDDETKYPECITLRDECYTIPAFGVLYGTQYQSFFKEINVSMEGSQATEPAIKNMFLIAGGSKVKTGMDSKTTIVGQNLFDVYSKNSYTCTVTMMGSAWMQPLMYFCLLNVPMFNGTYMIQKVTHTLDGNNSMTTNITGVRLPNLSQYKMEKNIFNYAVSHFDSFYTAPRLENGGQFVGMHDCTFAVYPVTKGKCKNKEVKYNSQKTDYGNAFMNEVKNIPLKQNLEWMPEPSNEQWTNLYEYLVVGIFNELIGTYRWSNQSEWKNMVVAMTNCVFELYKYNGSWTAFLDKDVVSSFFPNWLNGMTKYSDYVSNYNEACKTIDEVFESDGNCALFDEMTLSPLKYKYNNKEKETSEKPFKEVANKPYQVYLCQENRAFNLPEGRKDKDVYGKFGNMALVACSVSETKVGENEGGFSLHDAIRKSMETSPSIQINRPYSYKSESGVEGETSDEITYILEDSNNENRNVAAFSMILNCYSEYISSLIWVSDDNDETGGLGKISIKVREKLTSEEGLFVGRQVKGTQSQYKDYSSMADSEKKDFFVQCMVTKCGSDIREIKKYAPNNFLGSSDYAKLLESNPAFVCHYNSYKQQGTGVCNNGVKTNIGLVNYCMAQVNRNYWYGTQGQIATKEIYTRNKASWPKYYRWAWASNPPQQTDFSTQLGDKVHDCIGLIKAYFWTEGPEDGHPKPNGYCCPDKTADGFYEHCTRKGSSIDTLPEVPGIAVFKDGHAGVYIGNGKVIEARGHEYGVVITNLQDRHWQRWAFIDELTYI